MREDNQWYGLNVIPPLQNSYVETLIPKVRCKDSMRRCCGGVLMNAICVLTRDPAELPSPFHHGEEWGVCQPKEGALT